MSINTPDNEPYLGRELLLHYDKLLIHCFDDIGRIPKSVRIIDTLSYQKKMAAQVITQSLNLAASIRELIRQGYLFAARVLERSFFERIMILLYLSKFPDKIKIWNNGWDNDYKCRKELRAPSLGAMIKAIGPDGVNFECITQAYNDLVHGKPKSSLFGLIIGTHDKILSPSKTNNNTEDCDSLCTTMVALLAVLLAMIAHYFPIQTG